MLDGGTEPGRRFQGPLPRTLFRYMWGHIIEEHSDGLWSSRESECYLITQVEDYNVPFKPFQCGPKCRIDQVVHSNLYWWGQSFLVSRNSCHLVLLDWIFFFVVANISFTPLTFPILGLQTRGHIDLHVPSFYWIGHIHWPLLIGSLICWCIYRLLHR